MGRVTLDSTGSPSVSGLDAGDHAAPATAASGDGGGAGPLLIAPAEDRVGNLTRELGRLYDVLDCVGRQDAGSGGPALVTRAGDEGDPLASGIASDELAERLRSRVSAHRRNRPPKNPTALPTAAECRKSFAAVADAGFTEVHLRPVPYLNQSDERWGKHPYPRNPEVPGDARTIGSAGCAPTSLAMIDCGLRDSHVPPITTGQFAFDTEASGTQSFAGTNTAKLARGWADAQGLALTERMSSNRSKNVDALKAGLQANGIALVSVGADPVTHRAHFSSESHVLVVNGCARRNGEDWFAVADPGRRDQAKAKGDLLATDQNVVKVGGALNGVGQVWISRTQLEAEMKRCFIFQAGKVS